MRKKCCCTGHRPQGFAWDYYNKDLAAHKGYLGYLAYLVEEFIKDGYDYFISGGAIGADMDFAETVVLLKKEYPHIRLEMALPCTSQDRKWTAEDKARYQSILAQADEVNVLFSRYTSWCMDRRNRYMVDESNLVLVVWNGTKKGGTYNTKKYAEKKGREIECVLLPPKNADDETQFRFWMENAEELEGKKKKRERIKGVLRGLKEKEER